MTGRAGQSDDELLGLLAQAFAAPRTPDHASLDPAKEPPRSLVALRAAVGARRAWPGPVGTRPPGLSSRRRIRRRIAIPSLGGGLVLVGSSAAFALSGSPLPRPVRVVAHAVGLPVDSTAVADVRSTESKLRDALAHHDEAAVSRDAVKLKSRLAHLSGGERNDLGAEPADLLEKVKREVPETDEHRSDASPVGGSGSAPTTTEMPEAREGNETRGDGGTVSGGTTGDDHRGVPTTAPTATADRNGDGDHDATPTTTATGQVGAPTTTESNNSHASEQDHPDQPTTTVTEPDSG